MAKVPSKNVHPVVGRNKPLPGAGHAKYPAEVIGHPEAVKGAAKSRTLSHKAMGRHPRGV